MRSGDRCRLLPTTFSLILGTLALAGIPEYCFAQAIVKPRVSPNYSTPPRPRSNIEDLLKKFEYRTSPSFDYRSELEKLRTLRNPKTHQEQDVPSLLRQPSAQISIEKVSYVYIDKCELSMPALGLKIKRLVGREDVVRKLLEDRQIIFIQCECMPSIACDKAVFDKYITYTSQQASPLTVELDAENLGLLLGKIGSSGAPPISPPRSKVTPESPEVSGSGTGGSPPTPPQSGNGTNPSSLAPQQSCRLTGEICFKVEDSEVEFEATVECPPLPEFSVTSSGSFSLQISVSPGEIFATMNSSSGAQ